MIQRLTDSRRMRWGLAAALGPLTGPLALRALACHRAGDRLGAWGYALAIPAVWLQLTALAHASLPF